ncbi:hypothetical protein CSOJ01_02996 [Colletotrichum sojae]|uniref:Uncharacterized protein n=1 Tax=Colletotrichum sojae TaxID=2175907 RepID=A0A8H6JP11_9PEZI|nr:hypothetical protein CSOJ01_02996 [Colletotrichum sojae]
MNIVCKTYAFLNRHADVLAPRDAGAALAVEDLLDGLPPERVLANTGVLGGVTAVGSFVARVGALREAGSAGYNPGDWVGDRLAAMTFAVKKAEASVKMRQDFMVVGVEVRVYGGDERGTPPSRFQPHAARAIRLPRSRAAAD